MLKITESPRDAMQAMKGLIATTEKIKYIEALQKCKFDVIDVGSFVSPKAVPQMADTRDILKSLDNNSVGNSKISVLVANSRYAKELAYYDCVDYINYPLSISEKFQIKNLNVNHARSMQDIDEIMNISVKSGKQALISLSAAFGNPYNDEWSIEILIKWINYLKGLGLKYIPLADTSASSTSHNVSYVFSSIIEEFPDLEFNFHLHSKSDTVLEKVESAFMAGCRSFDTVYGNVGGCPMTGHELVANLDTIAFLDWADERGETYNIDRNALNIAVLLSKNVFYGDKISI